MGEKTPTHKVKYEKSFQEDSFYTVVFLLDLSAKIQFLLNTVSDLTIEIAGTSRTFTCIYIYTHISKNLVPLLPSLYTSS